MKELRPSQTQLRLIGQLSKQKSIEELTSPELARKPVVREDSTPISLENPYLSQNTGLKNKFKNLKT